MTTPRPQTGFTLIELIIVIIILGILAVTAAPKMLDLSGDAKKATLLATAGAIDSAVGMAQMKARIAQQVVPKNNGGNNGKSNNGKGKGNNGKSNNGKGKGNNGKSNNAGGTHVVNVGFGLLEIDPDTLCPVASATDAAYIGMVGLIDLGDELEVDEQRDRVRIGYSLDSANGTSGCYVEYQPGGNERCPVSVISTSC